MRALNDVKDLVEYLYPISVTGIQALHQFAFDWRGIYRIDDINGHSWVLRMFHAQDAAPWLAQAATLLRWLSSCGYAAPHVLLTTAGDVIGERAVWWTLLTSYIHGQPVRPTPINLRLLGATVARLHQVSVGATTPIPHSRWYLPRALPIVQQQLQDGLPKAPVVFQPLVRALLETVDQLRRRHELPNTVIHGDCWHANAIRTAPNTVMLIDWDNAGLGPAVLDLGQLLLTCHYDLANPLIVEPDEARIRAVMEGYMMQRRVTAIELGYLAEALRFGLAFHGGHYLAQAERVEPDDIVLKKLHVRYAATADIAHIAAMQCI